jgi:hypothetical protein
MCDFIGKTSRYEHGPTPIESTSGVNYNYIKIVHTSLYHYLISLGGDYINKIGKTPLDIQIYILISLNLFLNYTG